MMDSSQQQIPPPEPVVQTSETLAGPTPKKSNRNLLLIIGGALLVICVCTALCISVGGTGFLKIAQEREPVKEVIDSFMRAMVEKDADRGLALFSTRAQGQMTKSDIEKLLDGNNYVLFEGYQNLEINNLNISKAINTNQDLPQGTVAKVNGTVSYEGGFTGRFDAVLERDGDIWQLFHINVTVPPDKFSP